MKAFFTKLTVFSLAFVCIYMLCVHILSKDYVDIYYKKFTQEAGGLVIGISKASKGINPNIIENELKHLDFDTPIVNFALNVSNSKYGDIYFEAIKKKVNFSSKNQLFIVSVSPASFAAKINAEPEDIIEMDKKFTIVGKVDQVKAKPNFNYVIETYDQPLYNAFHPYEKDPRFTIHDNGWLEIKLDYSKSDSIVKNDILFWKSILLKHFKNEVKTQEVSEYRIKSFVEMIQFLKQNGSVFIITMPEDKEFIDSEKIFWPNFEPQMDSIAAKLNIPYINYWYLSGKLKTYDGLHLESESAKEFTHLLSKDIKGYLED